MASSTSNGCLTTSSCIGRSPACVLGSLSTLSSVDSLFPQNKMLFGSDWPVITPSLAATSPACGGGRRAKRGGWGLSPHDDFPDAETPPPQPSPASGRGGAPSSW